MIGQLWRFAGVGILATLTHMVVAIFAQSTFDLPAQVANFTGFCFAVCLSYVGHSFVTFRATENHILQVPRFALVALVGLATSSAITFVVVSQLQGSFVQAMIAMAMVVPPITFLVSKFWVFNDQHNTVQRWQGLLISLGISVIFLAVYWGRILDHDVSWYLVATRKWLFEGARIYVGLVEVNPPLNFYLTAPAVLLSDALNIRAVNAQYLVVAALMVASFTWVWNILEHDQRLSFTRRLFILIFVGFSTVLTAINNIAQREHLMLLFILPYVFGYLILPNPDKGKNAYARAGFAAIGLCIKPHFMIYPIMLTLLMIWRRKSLRPILSGANLAIVAVGAAYVGLVMVLHPEYLQEIVPMALHVYGAYGLGSYSVLWSFRPISILLFILISIMVLTKPEIGKGFGAFVAVIIAAIISFLLQWAGFSYHAIPIQAFILISSIWILAQPNRSATMAVLPIIVCLFIVHKQINTGTYKSWRFEYLKQNIGQQKSDYRLMIFSLSIGTNFPLALETDAAWVSRYPGMWLIPGAVNKISNTDCSDDIESCAEIQEILDQTRRDIVTDFENGDPDIVVIDNRSVAIIDSSFTFDKFLSQDPRYKPLLSNYRIKDIVTKDKLEFFVVMERKPNH